MSGAAWATLAVIASFVWGGFLLLLGVALRKERRKGGAEGTGGAERSLWVP